jgi:hypothetical protein
MMNYDTFRSLQPKAAMGKEKLHARSSPEEVLRLEETRLN